ncbi:MAG TPA: hypothetical protein VFF68_10545, partial [Anaerolineaceae bacterium]|nr:hypothetical protein [Anaerolineaceae bacterium]
SVVFYVLAAVTLLMGVAAVIALAGLGGSLSSTLSILPMPGEMGAVVNSLLARPMLVVSSWGSVVVGVILFSISLLLFAAGRLMRVQITLLEATERNRAMIDRLQAQLEGSAKA